MSKEEEIEELEKELDRLKSALKVSISKRWAKENPERIKDIKRRYLDRKRSLNPPKLKVKKVKPEKVVLEGYSVREFSSLLGFSRQRAHQIVKEGKITFSVKGNRLDLNKEDVENYVDAVKNKKSFSSNECAEMLGVSLNIFLRSVRERNILLESSDPIRVSVEEIERIKREGLLVERYSSKPNPQFEGNFSVSESASLLGISTFTLYKLIGRGQIKLAYNHPKRISEEELQRLLNKNLLDRGKSI